MNAMELWRYFLVHSAVDGAEVTLRPGYGLVVDPEWSGASFNRAILQPSPEFDATEAVHEAFHELKTLDRRPTVLAWPENGPGAPDILSSFGLKRRGQGQLLYRPVTTGFLTAWETKPDRHAMDGVRVRQITHDDDQRWLETVLAGFEVPVLMPPRSLPPDLDGPAPNPERTVFRLLAESTQGEPLGAATLVLWNGLGGLHTVAVPPQHRGRGVGRLLTQTRIQIARDCGATGLVTDTENPRVMRAWERTGIAARASYSVWY